MANLQHVELLLRDRRDRAAVWNQWRKEEPDTMPKLNGADLHNTDLSGVDLSGADLNETNLIDADLTGANLSKAFLFHADLSDAILRGANLYRAYLQRADLYQVDLAEAHLDGTNFSEASLAGANLSGTNLSSTNLIGANLAAAHLVGVNLCHTGLVDANLTNANLTNADLTGADLTGAVCLHTNFSGATLVNCNIYGISAWDVNLKGAIQADLRITSIEESAITVDNLEVAQFLYLLLHNEKMRAVLDTITSKVVLIVGRFGDHKPVLDALREALRRHSNGYVPVLFDFEPQTHKPVLETVKTLANLARFVVADLTDAHMIRAELTALTMSAQSVPIQPIIQGDEDLPTEYESWALARLFLPVHRYIDLPDLLANLNTSVIVPVEAHVHARKL